MSIIDPAVVNHLVGLDGKAVDRLVRALTNEANEIESRHKVGHLSLWHLQSVESTLADLRRRLTRIEAFDEITPD